MKKKFDFLPLTNSELFIKMKGNSISDRDHFEVHNSSQREAIVITGPRAANKD
jgi:hypothetical protein